MFVNRRTRQAVNETLWLDEDALVGSRSAEAGIKFFLLSAMSTAVLLYGMALIYGSTGSTLLTTIGTVLSKAQVPANTLLFTGMGLLRPEAPHEVMHWIEHLFAASGTH